MAICENVGGMQCVLLDKTEEIKREAGDKLRQWLQKKTKKLLYNVVNTKQNISESL